MISVESFSSKPQLKCDSQNDLKYGQLGQFGMIKSNGNLKEIIHNFEITKSNSKQNQKPNKLNKFGSIGGSSRSGSKNKNNLYISGEKQRSNSSRFTVENITNIATYNHGGICNTNNNLNTPNTINKNSNISSTHSKPKEKKLLINKNQIV